MKVRIYVEGGGDSNPLRTRCREAFSKFFEKANLQGRMPSIIACGTRNDAYDSFCTAMQVAGANDFPLLLVDSETAVGQAPWLHLKTRDNWNRPQGSEEEHAHLMVQCMEAWFLADRAQVAVFFGQGFMPNALPANKNVEEIGKAQVISGLKAATRRTKTKGEYDKVKHSFKLLGKIDPGEVVKVSPHAKRLMVIVKAKS